MNMKVLIAALVGGVVAFLLGWLIWGTLLMGYYEASMIHYEGLMKTEGDMNLGLMFLSNLTLSLLMSLLFLASVPGLRRSRQCGRRRLERRDKKCDWRRAPSAP